MPPWRILQLLQAAPDRSSLRHSVARQSGLTAHGSGSVHGLRASLLLDGVGVEGEGPLTFCQDAPQ
eukprot:8726305-Alexandrium_andersonii.AAC.1